MTDFEKMVLDLLIGLDFIELVRLVLWLIRVARTDWRRKREND